MADRLEIIRSLNLPYVIVDPSSSSSNGFVLFGQANFGEDFEDVFNLSETVDNCKPGVWFAALRDKPVESSPSEPVYELCFRWIGELNEKTQFDFSADVDEWKAWGEKMSVMFPTHNESTGWDTDVDWTSRGSYYDDGGILSVVSKTYLTEQTANAVINGMGDQEEDDLDVLYYLETIVLNNEESVSDDIESNYTLGGVCLTQDAVGCPARVAIGERDGMVVAVKFFDGEDQVRGYRYATQPGGICF